MKHNKCYPGDDLRVLQVPKQGADPACVEGSGRASWREGPIPGEEPGLGRDRVMMEMERDSVGSRNNLHRFGDLTGPDD